MSEMVEKVARALHEQFRKTYGGAAQTSWDDLSNFNRNYGLGLARAAIAAMREPTEAMVDRAAMDEIFAPRLCWVDMIDEALT